MCSCSKKSNLTKGLVALVIGFALFSMGAAKASSSQHDSMKKTMRISLSPDTKQEVVKTLEANEKLHLAFFEYNGETIEKEAKALIKAISSIKDSKISKLLKFSKTKLLEMKKGSSKEDNNQNYHLVSMALIYIVGKYDVGSKYNAYSCPMVKKKWLQNSKKLSRVHNPYASEMPHCGSQETKH